MVGVHISERRWWLGVQLVALANALTLFVGGLVGQACPAHVGKGSLKTGPFAYGDGATTQNLSYALMLATLIGAVVAIRRQLQRRFRPLSLLHGVANTIFVGFGVVWAISFGAAQVHSAMLCEAGDAWSIAAWHGGALLVAVLGNWPFATRSNHQG